MLIILIGIINLLFEHVRVHKIAMHCSAENIASWKLMEKLGMKKEAYFKDHSFKNGKWCDDLSYGLLNK